MVNGVTSQTRLSEWAHTCAHTHRRGLKAFRIVTPTEGTTDRTVCYNHHIITTFISIY